MFLVLEADGLLVIRHGRTTQVAGDLPEISDPATRYRSAGSRPSHDCTLSGCRPHACALRVLSSDLCPGRRTDQPGDLHGHAGLLGGLPDRRIGCALARIDVPAGQFPVTGITAAHQQQPPAMSRTAAKAHGATQLAAGASG